MTYRVLVAVASGFPAVLRPDVGRTRDRPRHPHCFGGALGSPAHQLPNQRRQRDQPRQQKSAANRHRGDAGTLARSHCGAPSRPGYWIDLLAYVGDPTPTPATLKDLFVVNTTLPTALQTFDPTMRRGWRGPYLTELERYLYGECYQWLCDYLRNYR